MKIILDGMDIKDKNAFHILIKDKLDLSSFYGENLDALWDELSCISYELDIELINSEIFFENLGGYGDQIVDLFEDLKNENKNISFFIKS